MAIFTPRFNLRKPDRTEYFSIVRDFNDNWDKLDLLVAKETDLQAVESRVGVIESDVVIIESDIDSLELRATTAESDIDNLELSKVDKITGKGLSENDYTDADKLLLTETIPAQLAEITQDITDLGNDKVDKLKATNLVINGDFSQGTTGWSGINGISSITTVAEKLNVVCVGGSTVTRAYQTTSALYAQGDQIYASADCKMIDSSALNIYLSIIDSDASAGIIDISKGNPVANTLYKISGIKQLPAGTGANIKVFTCFNESVATVGKKAEFDNILLINLTATFGAGNEPTKEQMDRLLAEFPNSWFDGTQEILPLKVIPQLLEEKANKVQEPWIIPTLQNGWVQNGTTLIGYFKDSLGNVHLRGRISGGSLGISCFTLPVGYRPAQAFAFGVTDVNGTLKSMSVSPSGSVVIWASPTTHACFDNVYFKQGV